MGELIGLAEKVGLPGYLLLMACAIGFVLWLLFDIRRAMQLIVTCEERHKAVDRSVEDLDCRVVHLETKVFDL